MVASYSELSPTTTHPTHPSKSNVCDDVPDDAQKNLLAAETLPPAANTPWAPPRASNTLCTSSANEDVCDDVSDGIPRATNTPWAPLATNTP